MVTIPKHGHMFEVIVLHTSVIEHRHFWGGSGRGQFITNTVEHHWEHNSATLREHISTIWATQCLLVALLHLHNDRYERYRGSAGEHSKISELVELICDFQNKGSLVITVVHVPQHRSTASCCCWFRNDCFVPHGADLCFQWCWNVSLLMINGALVSMT